MFSFNGIAVPNRSNMLTHEELKKVINQIHFNDRAQVCETCHDGYSFHSCTIWRAL